MVLKTREMQWQERKTYVGQWVNGKRTGKGKMVWKNGEEYDGEWLDNLQVKSTCFISDFSNFTSFLISTYCFL